MTAAAPSDHIRCITSSLVAATSQRLARLRDGAAAAGLDALVSLSPENVAYTCGFVVPSQALMRWRHAATVIDVNGGEAMLCVDMEESTVREARPDLELRVWREFGGNAMHSLAGLLDELGLAGKRVGIETSYLPAHDFAELCAALPKAELAAADAVLAQCRRIKTADELALLGRLSRIADTAIADACARASAGCSEMDIAAELTRSVYENGAQQFKLMIVATGERSQLPNVGPTRRLLEPGDVCRFEIFAVIDGYHAGVCRTAVVGEPGPDALRVYSSLVECRQLVLGAIRPGVAARDVYRSFRRRFDELAMPAISFVGHGIGLDLHEAPYLAEFDDSVLVPGLVMGVEPLVYRSGHGFGMQVKDMVAITGSGATLLSDVSPTDHLLAIEA